MNATNPFQIPSCFQNDQEFRRRERFKRVFVAVVATGILFLVGLLIEGCMSQHASITGATSGMAVLTEPPSNPPTVVTAPKAVSIPQPIPQPAMSQSATAVSKVTTLPAGRPQVIYTVKSGDNLTRIAKTHATTVEAIKAANGLSSDRIAVGTKLKLPQV
jgi:LysM repeat protein